MTPWLPSLHQGLPLSEDKKAFLADADVCTSLSCLGTDRLLPRATVSIKGRVDLFDHVFDWQKGNVPAFADFFHTSLKSGHF